LACSEIGLPAAYFTGDSHGQGKESCCDAQEKQTWQGKGQACTQDGGKAHDSEEGKVQGQACRQKYSETGSQKKRPLKTAARKAPRKAPRQVVVPVEDTIIDVIEEPVPGAVVVTEYESIRTATPISSGRDVRLSYRSPTDAISRDIALDNSQSDLSILQHLHNITNSPKPISYASGHRPARQPIPLRRATKPRHATKPSKIRDVNFYRFGVFLP